MTTVVEHGGACAHARAHPTGDSVWAYWRTNCADTACQNRSACRLSAFTTQLPPPLPSLSLSSLLDSPTPYASFMRGEETQWSSNCTGSSKFKRKGCYRMGGLCACRVYFTLDFASQAVLYMPCPTFLVGYRLEGCCKATKFKFSVSSHSPKLACLGGLEALNGP